MFPTKKRDTIKANRNNSNSNINSNIDENEIATFAIYGNRKKSFDRFEKEELFHC